MGGTERRVLVLRAGLQGEPLSVTGTARALGLTRQQTVAAQRAGLRRLRGAGRAGGCPGTAAAPAATTTGFHAFAGLTSPLATMTMAAATPASPHAANAGHASKRRDRGAVLSQRASSDDPPKQPPAASSGLVVQKATNDGGSSLPVALLVAAVLAAMAATLTVQVRRRRSAADGGAPVLASASPWLAPAPKAAEPEPRAADPPEEPEPRPADPPEVPEPERHDATETAAPAAPWLAGDASGAGHPDPEPEPPAAQPPLRGKRRAGGPLTGAASRLNGLAGRASRRR